MQSTRSQPLMVLVIVAAAVLLVGGLQMCSSKPDADPQRAPAPLVRLEVAEPHDHQFFVRAHGSVSPRRESDLVPQVAGEVIWVSRALAAGGFFQAGDPLLRIDPADHEVELEAARATVARAESEYERAKTELARQQQLVDRSVASQTLIDDAENDYRVKGSALIEARARRKRAKRDLERTEIRAPYPGRVRSEQVDVGQFVQRGNPVASIYSVDFAEIRLPLPDRELAYLEVPLVARNSAGAAAAAATSVGHGQDGEVDDPPGTPVRLSAHFAGGQYTWEGTIVRTEGELDARSRMVHVVARVADPYGGDAAAPLAVGLFVEAEIAGRTVKDAFLLPREALRHGDRVYVIDDEDLLRIRDVEVLRTEREQVVIGKGLRSGDRVCVSPLAAAVEGMRVRVSGDEAAVVGASS